MTDTATLRDSSSVPSRQDDIKASGTAAPVHYSYLGEVEYEEAQRLQNDLGRRRALGEIPDTLLLLEHPPVYTTGRRGPGANLRVPEEDLGAPLVMTDRGGEITFHGTGQLIAYPIIDLKAAGLSVVNYVRALEETIVRTLHCYGIEAQTECGLTGAWVGNDKIAAIGVRVSKPAGPAGAWVTTHGLALNVSVDLGWFERIVPCGISDRGVTSIRTLRDETLPIEDVATNLVARFGRVFGRTMRSHGLLPAS